MPSHPISKPPAAPELLLDQPVIERLPPATSNLAVGLVIPIPTLPVGNTTLLLAPPALAYTPKYSAVLLLFFTLINYFLV